MSPAAMYSLARATIAKYASRGVLDVTAMSVSTGPASAELSIGASSASTTRVRRSTARLCACSALWPHRRHDRDLVFDRIEHHDRGRAHQHRVGEGERVRLVGRQALHQADH